MPNVNRMYCSNCKTSIYNTFIGPDGKRSAEGTRGAVRVPLVLYFVVGQPPDTGETLGVNDPGVKLPSFVRELMQAHVPVARVELCMLCVAEVFGTKLYTADADPMHSPEQTAVTATKLAAAITPAMPEVDKHALQMERALLAVKVGRGGAKAPKLPKPTGIGRRADGKPPAPVTNAPPIARKPKREKPRVLHVEPPKS